MIREWWQNLTSRDQKFVLGGSIIGLILLIYTFIWLPLNTAVDSLKQQVNDQSELLVWLKAATSKVQQYHSSGFYLQNRGNQPLLTFLNYTLMSNNLQPYSPQTTLIDSNTIAINFNQVPFDNLIAWLETLWQNYGLDVRKITILPTPTSGLVKAQLIIAT